MITRVKPYLGHQLRLPEPYEPPPLPQRDWHIPCPACGAPTDAHPDKILRGLGGVVPGQSDGSYIRCAWCAAYIDTPARYWAAYQILSEILDRAAKEVTI